ncbi:MAG: DNA translocase FtsK [Eubacteriales bacterium]|nr:DNA translocase FtsK [Eubacteriales bacterium]
MAAKKTRATVGRAQTKREVWGVLFIAFGLFFAVSLYSDAVGIVGTAISGFLFGLTGLLGYALPVLTVALGVFIIAVTKRAMKVSTLLTSMLGVLFLMVLFHVFKRTAIENVSLLQFIKDAYTLGKESRTGGGFFGGLLAYPSLHLLGTVGSYIFYIAGALICVLVLTRISLRRTGEKVGQSIKAGVENVTELFERGGELYTEDLSDTANKPEPRARRGRREVRQEAILQADARKVKNAEEELNFLPASGTIEKKQNAARKPERSLAFHGKGETDDTLYDDYIPPEPPPPSERVSRISKYAPLPAEPVIPEKKHKNTQQSVEPIVPPHTDVPVIEYQRPPFTLLKKPSQPTGTAESPAEKGRLLLETLSNFNIEARIINVSVGPVVTRYELQPAQGVRVNRITTLGDDIALALAAPSVRIEAPIPGKAAIGIEIPNKDVASVVLRELIESRDFQGSKSPITFALGKDIAGKIVCADLDKMPHLLIAGTTGSGKSVCINNIILSMIYKSSPADVRMILVDPKVVELKVFSPMPHLLLPVVTEPKKAVSALKWAVTEMEQRYKKMAKFNARDLARYNALQALPEDRLPKIVIIVDEFADLMMVASREVEDSIRRIAQLGRASGIHLIIATQSPRADVITGLIKSNIQSRIALTVSSGLESRIILDENGAEQLLGKGDLLFHVSGANKPLRAQGAYVSDEEVEAVMGFFSQQKSEPQFEPDVLSEIDGALAPGAQGNGKQEDELLPEAVRIVLDSGQASISMIQRRLRVGYARAARLIDIMEQKGIVSGFDGAKPRKILIDQLGYERMFGSELSEDE